MSSPLSIDSARLRSDLMVMGAIGATAGGGCFSPAASDAVREARNLLAYWAKEADLSVSIDAIGNMFARRQGDDPSLPPLVIGSHLDTLTPAAADPANPTDAEMAAFTAAKAAYQTIFDTH
ncbi:acetylornithine deacetylase/succinyl-diaminopimelate desuccinylase-like protein [Bradyrhizobium sp. AZCC 2262]|uniref:hypothetical protein n=1 Tax=Bradyrhizobium sp. AZCC 2262 TaxID=3117022 RepID=UPI002FF3DFD5